MIMKQILSSIPSDFCHKDHFHESSGSAISNEFQFVFANPGSLPQPVITLQVNGKKTCLIASEAKSLDSSMYKTYAQVVQLASDCAVNISTCYGEYIPCEKVVLPFVTTSWDDIQFGAVSLMENNYPTSVLLSRRLSLNCHEDMLQICYWILSLSKHCMDVATTLAPLFQHATSSSSSATVHPKASKKRRVISTDVRCQISSVALPDPNRFLFKPVTFYCHAKRENMPSLFRSILSGLMSRFYDLYHFRNGVLRDIVVFPEGVIGFPEKSKQNHLSKCLKSHFRVLCSLKNVPEDYFKRYCRVGYPIVVYRLLSTTEWHRSDELLRCKNETLIREFMQAVRAASELICEAGVIHTDLRLCNIFYRLNNSHAASNSQDTVTHVDVKIIDWDDSVRVGEHVPSELLEGRRLHPDFPVGASVATSGEYHDFFVKRMEKKLIQNLTARDDENEDDDEDDEDEDDEDDEYEDEDDDEDDEDEDDEDENDYVADDNKELEGNTDNFMKKRKGTYRSK